MCGIVGVLDNSKIDESLLTRMADVLSHRGPDDHGVYTTPVLAPTRWKYGNVGLAHRRLSIIDLSQAGHQPMSNEDASVVIVYNGEIYNFPLLRKELEDRGHKFKSHTDTETIIHLYEEEGIDCVKKLRGMFAFGIWDKRKQRIFLARDRVGKKPLYYYHKNDTFIFASEIKSILLHPKVDKQVNRTSVHHYLTYGYTPSPNTMFKDIKKIPPGHILVCEKNKVKVSPYWKLTYSNKQNKLSFTEIKERLLYLIKDAVKVRLISDVPLGAFLSGGVDSSAIVAFMSETMNMPVKTFSIGFENTDYDELKYARIVADMFATEHREFIVKPNAIDVLPKLIWYYNEPFGDSSCIPSYYLTKMTRECVTVALNGDGGDESFAGYDRYKGVKLSRWVDNMPGFIYKFGISVIKALENISGNRKLRRKRHFLEAMLEDGDYKRRYCRWIGYFTNKQKYELYSDLFNEEVKDIDSVDWLVNIINNSDAPDEVDKVINADVLSYLPEDLLVKMDIASMANSLEARSPFLDHHIMEFMASVSSNIKLKGFTSKYLLKEVLKDILPPEILYRNKMGFGVPVAEWFKKELKEYVSQILFSDKALKRGYFKKESIEKILKEHNSGEKDHQYRIWSLLNLELWHNEFID